MTVRELAKRTRIPRSSLSDYLTGTTAVPQHHRNALADVLDTSPRMLWPDVVEPMPVARLNHEGPPFATKIEDGDDEVRIARDVMHAAEMLWHEDQLATLHGKIRSLNADGGPPYQADVSALSEQEQVEVARRMADEP